MSLLSLHLIGSRLVMKSATRVAAGRSRFDKTATTSTWPRADLQLAIHPGRATTMAEASRAVNRRLLKSIGILTAKRRIDFPRRENFGVLRV